MKVTKEEILQAFIWLKRDNYYDRINLFLRKKIADFESSPNFDEKLDNIVFRFKKIKRTTNSLFTNLLQSIDFNLIPKKYDNDRNEDKEKINSNLREFDSYKLSSVNYFIDAPIELLIISVLWAYRVGNIFDKQLDDNCLGYRLNFEKKSQKPFSLYKYYLPLYNRWRDKAIDIGLSNLKNGNDVLLIALDIKECFYNVGVKWDSVKDQIKQDDTFDKDLLLLTNCIEKIHQAYFNKIRPFLGETHYCPERYPNGFPNEIIPIGLPSSGILANWELRKLDEAFKKKLRPLYYGRYVDDILIVINNPDIDLIKGTSQDDVFKYLFSGTDILDNCEGESGKNEENYYKFSMYDFLVLQRDKLIIHYYNHNSHWAGLTKFKKELMEQASEFRFLPEDFSTRELSDEAYDIEYNESINKLRNVIGVKENSFRLVTYLYNLQLKKWLTHKKVEKSIYEQLKRYFQGINILNHFKVWERIFVLLISDSDWELVLSIFTDIQKCIQQIEYPNKKLQKRIINNTINYLEISFSISLALLSQYRRKACLDKFCEDKKQIFITQTIAFRNSRLIRHQFSSWPLLEYECEDIDLLELPDFSTSKEEKLTNFEKIPRYIHFEEYQLFILFKNGISKSIPTNFQDLIIEYKKEFMSQNIYSHEFPFTYSDNPPTVVSNMSDDREKFVIGLVNIKIPKENIKSAIAPPHLSICGEKLQEQLYYILNEADKNRKCDLIILPEVSVPIHFLPFLVNQSRKRQIGLVFGCEHVIFNKECLNLVVVVLPEKNKNGYSECSIYIRNKNFYAPKEEELIKSYKLDVHSVEPQYMRHYWRNCYFSTYNCYELTEIKGRGEFRSLIDLLIGISWNRDINRFSNIVESTVRDVHCYVSYVNASQFGDSRIVAPKKTEEMNIVRISGGLNTVLLKGEIDITALREFQKHSYLPNDESFKPTPAGFEHENVRNGRQKLC